MHLSCADIDLIQGFALLLLALAIVPRLAARLASYERSLWLLGIHGVSRGLSVMAAAGQLGLLWGWNQPVALLLRAVSAYSLCLFGWRALRGQRGAWTWRASLGLCIPLCACFLSLAWREPMLGLLFCLDWFMAIPGALLSAFVFLRVFGTSKGETPRRWLYSLATLVVGLSFVVLAGALGLEYFLDANPAGQDAWTQLSHQHSCDWVRTLSLVFCSGGISFLLRHLSEAAHLGELAANTALAARSFELGVLNDTLESRVRERTEELVRSNSELQREISTRRTAEDELLASAARLQALFDQDAVGIAFLDTDGRFLRVNQRFADMVGRSREEVVRLGFRELTDPEFLDGDRLLWNEVMSGTRQSYVREKRYLRPDGSFVWASVRVAVVRSDQGDIRHFVGIYEDIQERRRTADALRENERRLHMALAASQQTLFEFDAGSGRFTFAEEFLGGLGWSPALFPCEFERWLESVHGDDRVPLRTALLACLTGQQSSLSLEYRQRAANGSWRWVMMRGSLISREQPGAPRRILGTLMDCTDRRQLDERLRRTQRLESIGSLAGGIAHDLNNALVPLLAGVAFLRDYVPEGDTELVTAMDTSARRAASMVQHLLAFARGAEGRRAPVQPAALVEEMQRFVSSTFPHNIQFHGMCLCQDAVITGDATQLHQILLNLCVNARDAMPTGGALTLEASLVEVDQALANEHDGAKPGPHVLFQVTDTGTGIPASIRERIFDPFFSTKGVDKGTGLGLSTVLGIVRGHNGFVILQSEEGQGTSFRVYLPHAELETLQARGARSAAPMLEGKGRRILLVEDQAIVQQMIRRVLGKAGFSFVCASDGVEALAWLGAENEPIDLLLLDLNMPNMGGLDLLQVLRGKGMRIPTLVMSGNFTREEQVQLRELGVRELLPKPFDGPDLSAAVHRSLEAEQPSASV